MSDHAGILGDRWMRGFCDCWDKTFLCRGKMCLVCPLKAAHFIKTKGGGIRTGVGRFLRGVIRTSEGRKIMDDYLRDWAGVDAAGAMKILQEEG